METMLKTRYDGRAFVPETSVDIPQGKVVYITITQPAKKTKHKNPSPSGDPYFDNSKNIETILRAEQQVREGKVVELTPELKKQMFVDL